MPNNLLNEILLSQSAKRTVKQERIIETAIRLFAEKGYSNTSTAEIAKAAEVSEASIFKQYGTKDKLLLALIVPHLKEILPSIADDTINQINKADSTFEQFLTALFRNRMEFVMENREIFQIIIKELIYKEELKHELFPYFAEVITSRLTKVIEAFQKHGELPDIPVERILKLLFTFVGGFFASRFVLLNQESVPEEEVQDAIRFIMNGIRNRSE